MTFEKHLDISIMFDDIFAKCKTKEELDAMQYDLACAMDDCYSERLSEIEE